MSWRGTLTLALLAIILGAYVWFGQPAGEETMRGAEILEAPQRQPTTALPPLLEFTPADITAIRLQHDGRTLEVARQDGGWRQTQPPQAIEDFLRNLSRLAVLSEIPATGGDLKDYGLQPARSLLELQRREHPPLMLQIGDRNPATTGVYARVDNGPVVLAGALVEWEFQKIFKALSTPPPTEGQS